MEWSGQITALSFDNNCEICKSWLFFKQSIPFATFSLSQKPLSSNIIQSKFISSTGVHPWSVMRNWTTLAFVIERKVEIRGELQKARALLSCSLSSEAAFHSPILSTCEILSAVAVSSVEQIGWGRNCNWQLGIWPGVGHWGRRRRV